jgi:hypothetical protein
MTIRTFHKQTHLFMFMIHCCPVRFQVLMVAGVKMADTWVVTLCSLVEVYHYFSSACCLHQQDDADGGSKHH